MPLREALEVGRREVHAVLEDGEDLTANLFVIQREREKRSEARASE